MPLGKLCPAHSGEHQHIGCGGDGIWVFVAERLRSAMLVLGRKERMQCNVRV